MARSGASFPHQDLMDPKDKAKGGFRAAAALRAEQRAARDAAMRAAADVIVAQSTVGARIAARAAARAARADKTTALPTAARDKVKPGE